MEFIKSSDIKVYPASSRGIGSELLAYSGNPESKLNTEDNIVGLINRIAKIRNNTNKENSTINIEHSFVISDDINNDAFEVCINGYYFRIVNISNYLSSFTNDVYAKIIVKSNKSNYLISELSGYSQTTSKVVDDLDTNNDTGNFIAMLLESDNDVSKYKYDDCSCYCLHILTKSSNKWTIPTTSKIVITADYVGLSDCNGNLHNLYEYFEKDNNGNLIIKQAKKLQDTHTFWGQKFDGSQNVSGNLTSVGNITPSSSSNYNIGSSNTKFKDAYVDNVYSSNVTSNKVVPSSSSDSMLGTLPTPYDYAYINTINSENLSILGWKYLYTKDDEEVWEKGNSQIIIRGAYTIDSDGIGSSDDMPSYIYTDALYTNTIGSSTSKPTNIYTSNLYANYIESTNFKGELEGNSSSATKLKTTRKVVVNNMSRGSGQEPSDYKEYGSFTYDGSSNSELTLTSIYAKHAESATTLDTIKNNNTESNNTIDITIGSETIKKTINNVTHATNATNVDTLTKNDANDNVVKFTIGDKSYEKTINNVSNATNASLANKADSLNMSSAIGAWNKPIYFNNEGKPIAIDYTIETSVPSGAKFTDTVYTLPSASSTTLGGVKLSLVNGVLTISTN